MQMHKDGLGNVVINTEQQAIIANSFNVQIFDQFNLDVQHTPIYDTVTFAANTAVSEGGSFFFTNVGPGAGKTQAQTNMTQQQRLQAPEAFSIYGFRIKWNENALFADLIQLVNGFAFNFNVNTKSYNRAPLWHYAAGGGIYANGLITSTTAGLTQVTNLTSSTNGVPSRDAMHKLALTIPLENQVGFFGNLLGNNITLAAAGAGGTGLVLVATLDGLYARGIL